MMLQSWFHCRLAELIICQLRDLLVFTVFLTLLGCVAAAPVKQDSSTAEPAEPVKSAEPVTKQIQEFVYPPPPEQPRYYFERSLISNGQVETIEENKESYWRELLTGEKGDKYLLKGMAKPYDVAACQDRVFVSDTVARLVFVFDFARQRFIEIGAKEPGALLKPFGLNTDAACNLYVADVSQNRIQIYDKEANYLSSVNVAGKFNAMSHLAVTADGSKLFVVDSGGVSNQEHRIRVIDAHSGESLYDIGTRGSEDGTFNLPKDIEIGQDGNLYIVDAGNFRIQVLTQEGKFIRSFGQAGARPGNFSRPKGIAIDKNKGIIFVADSSFANFQLFNTDGELLMHIGQKGNRLSPATYLLPAGIDVDENGRVYVVDQWFRKVDVFRPADLPADTGAIGQRFITTRINPGS